jgi:lysophospholipase L1-like esterase
MQCILGGKDVSTAAAEAGNYAVTVRLGGAVAGQTSVSAEANRGLLSLVSTAAGESREYAFVVNVREKEGMPGSVSTDGFPGLDLFFSGPSPLQVSAIGYSLVSQTTKPVMVYLASDSTVGDQLSDFAGWGQMLPQLFATPVGVANYGTTGASAASFLANALLWPVIKSQWAPGDWVVVQFGTSEKVGDDAALEASLETYLDDARTAQVNAIIVSPPARATFSGTVLTDQTGLHAAAAKVAAFSKAVPFIDLTALSSTWYNSLGPTVSLMMYHANGSDPSHTNLLGATELAKLVAGVIKSQNIGLAPYLRQ